MKNKSATDSLPIKPVLEELAFVRRTFREVAKHYAATIESEIAQLETVIAAEAEQEKPSKERMHELRDMMILMRSLDVKPDKGRRRDLKRIESLLADLRSIVERW